MTRAAVYARQSVEDKEGMTIAAQVAACREHCQHHGYEVAAEYKDNGVSGAVPFDERPDGKLLLKAAGEGAFTKVIVYCVDRLGRDVVEGSLAREELERNGAPLEFVAQSFDDTPEGTFMFQVFLAVAELERQLIRRRTMKGRLRAVNAGKFAGGSTPYGYRNDPETKAFVVDEAEAAVVGRIFRLYVEEGLSHERLAVRLTAEGVPTRNRQHPKARGEWNSVVISNILRNPAYKGHGYYGKTRCVEAVNGNGEKKTYQRFRPQDEWIPLAFPPIVTEEVWEAARERARSNLKQSQHPNEANEIFATAGLVKCGVCLGKMTGERRYSHYKGHERMYYYVNCSKQRKGLTDCRPRPLVRRDKIEAAVLAEVTEAFSDPERVLAACRAYGEQQAAAQQDSASLLAALRRNIAQAESERDGYERQLAKGLITEAKALQHFARVDGEIVTWQADLERIQLEAKKQAAVQEIQASAFRIAALVRGGALQKMALAQRRRLVRALVERVRVLADNTIVVDCLVPGLLSGSVQAPSGVLSIGGSRRDSFPSTWAGPPPALGDPPNLFPSASCRLVKGDGSHIQRPLGWSRILPRTRQPGLSNLSPSVYHLFTVLLATLAAS